MLQQTRVKTVIPYWERWLRAFPTLAAAAEASSAKLHKLWEGLGYYTRVRNLQKAAQQIVARHDGGFPQDYDAILALPGIGRYTAGAICSIAFDQPRPILDGNVIRVLTRLFGITTDPREKETNARLWGLAQELVDHASDSVSRTRTRMRTRKIKEDSACSCLNQSLMELGALICTPRAPQCDACPLAEFCVACRRGWQEKLPNSRKNIASTARRFVAFIAERNGRYLVRQRPSGVVNAHLWEFPNVEVEEAPTFQPALPGCEFRPTGSEPLFTIKHTITRYRITLEAWRVQPTEPAAKIPGRWLTLKQLHQLAFTSAHKRILHAVAADIT